MGGIWEREMMPLDCDKFREAIAAVDNQDAVLVGFVFLVALGIVLALIFLS